MTSLLIENLVERVAQNRPVLPHTLFDEIAKTLNERFHNYHVFDSLEEIDWAFCSEHFMYESFRDRVAVEEKPEGNTALAVSENDWWDNVFNFKIFKTK